MALKIHQIPIERIGINRQLQLGDDVTKLSESIRGEGQARAIIVDKNLNLIDGLRRIRAIQMADMPPTVAVMVSDTLEETEYAYTRTHKHGVLELGMTYHRMWEFFKATYDQQRERTARTRRSKRSLGEVQPARAFVAQMLGVPSESTLATANLLYKAFESNVDPTRQKELDEIRRALEADEITLYGALGLLTKMDEPEEIFTGNILTASDQRNALTAAIAQLSGTNKGLNRLGELHPGINQHELAAYVKAFEAERKALRLTVAKLRKRVTE